MNHPFFWLTLLLAACDWAATWRQHHNLRWVTKPGTLAALIAWFAVSGGFQGNAAWFGAGLVFSLLGDTLLMLPARFFPLGGAAFFVTHVLYITGFVASFQGQPAAAWSPAVGLLTVMSSPTRRKSAAHTAGVAAAGAYGLTILLMTLCAVFTLWQPAWKANAAIMVALGAVLFLISDAVLAFNRFIRPTRFADMVVMVTYHTGQILLAAGVLANFTAAV